MKSKTKTFDCVEMMHQGARRIYEDTKGMTVAEELAYWRRRNKEARGGSSRVRKAGEPTGAPK